MLIWRNENINLQVLPAEQIKHLDEMERLFLQIGSMDNYAGFSYGFRLGIQLMHEALQEDLGYPPNWG